MTYFVNVDVALYRDDRWLLIVRGVGEGHAAGMLSLVGGTLDAREPASDVLERTARREVLEEVGLTLDGSLEYVENTFFSSDDGNPVLNVVFVAPMPDAEPRISAPEEVADLVMATLGEVTLRSDCPPWTLRSLRRAAAQRVRSTR
jgi:8-oxo-dGTP pyrophosphatase MutT (NUDIX family)